MSSWAPPLAMPLVAVMTADLLEAEFRGASRRGPHRVGMCSRPNWARLMPAGWRSGRCRALHRVRFVFPRTAADPSDQQAGVDSRRRFVGEQATPPALARSF